MAGAFDVTILAMKEFTGAIALVLALVGTFGTQAAQPLDEMEADWVAKDGPLPTNVTHAAWRAEKLRRRAERLRPVLAMSSRWVYCRHYVVSGGRSTFLHLSELSDAFEQRGYRAIGSSICLADHSPDGLWKETTLIETKAGCFRDVDVSIDGTRILYSYKASDRGDDFHLYEMDLATRKVRQLTFGIGVSDIEGCYLPDGRILFNSTRCGQIVDCWWNEVLNLYRCDADGRNITRITYDQVNDYFPTLQDDGRVFYMRWEYNDRGQIYTQPVFSMNPDGTYQRAHYGGNSYFPNCILGARRVPGSQLFFAIGTGHHSWEPGQLLRFDPRAGREETAGCWEVAPLRRAHYVERDGNFGQQGDIYNYPYPVDEDSVVIAHLRDRNRRDADHAFGLCWTDVHGAREVLVAQRGKVSIGRPIPVRARQLPALSSKRPDETLATGTVLIADVYAGESMKGVPRGMVKSLRVVGLSYRVAGIGRSVVLGPGGFAMNATPPGAGNTTWIVKKPLGEVPVSADGSVCVRLPARTPFYFQLLDGKGRMVQTMRSWTMLQPGENASCVGCHESANDAPGYQRAPVRSHQTMASLPPAKEGFSFMREVQPILDRRCVRCHNPHRRGEIPDLTSLGVRDQQAKRWWTKSYLALTHANYIDKGLAKRHGRASVWWENLWVADPAHPVVNWVDNGSTVSLAPPLWRGSLKSTLFTEKLDRGHAPGLTDEEYRTLARWVDLGVPFCGSYDERADWTSTDHELWNRGLARRARFRTDGEPEGGAAWAWSVEADPFRARNDTVADLMKRHLIHNTNPACFAFTLKGTRDKPETITLTEGVLDLEGVGCQLQCGFGGERPDPAPFAAHGVINQTGGEIRVSNYAVFGRFANDIGRLNLTGGIFRMQNPKCCVYVGEEGEGHVRVGGTGQLIAANISMGRAKTSRNSTLTIEKGGRVCMGALQDRGSVNPSLVFDGGTLETYGAGVQYPEYISRAIAVKVRSRGARIGVALNSSAVIPTPLVEDAESAGGGFAKAGYGLLEFTGANTYTGLTRVEAGRLLVKDASAVAKSRAIEVAGLAGFGVWAENLKAANRQLRGKIKWEVGSVVCVDTRHGSVVVGGDDFLGAAIVEKLGPHDLVISSPLNGVSEIRIRGGHVKTTGPGIIPATTQVQSLGGSLQCGSGNCKTLWHCG